MSTDNEKITPEWWYKLLVLSALIKMGGSAERERILSHIRLHHENLLTKKDLEDYESGHGERWKNHISFARQHLIERGYLANNSPHGIWEITDEGRRQYTEWTELIRQNSSQSKNDGNKAA